MNSDEEKSWHNLEQQGEYEAAAAAYARAGFEDLIDAEFELADLQTQMGIGLLLRAISCDRRAENHRRPAYLARICRPLLQEIRETSDDRIQAGVATEWLGDLALMLGQDDLRDVRSYYDEADEQFDHMDWQDELTWSHEPDFGSAYWAIQGFSEYHDGPLPEDPGTVPHDADTMSFHERLEKKRKFADQMLN